MTGHVHRPANPNGDALILTHGAGANAETPLLIALANAFCESGLTVLRYNLHFRQQRPNGPPPRGSAEHDQQGLREAIASLRSQTSGRIFLGGHSYGGRQSSLVAVADPILVDALLLLSYPLHPPRRPEDLRTAHFPDLHTPALFVHGTRDPFGTLEQLSIALELIPCRTQLLTIPAAGHELLSKKNTADLPALVAQTFLSFATPP